MEKPQTNFWASPILSLEKAMATHSSTLAWKIPWTEEPGGLQSMGLLRVGHDCATSLWLFTFMHWRRKWQPTPGFLPGESQGRGSLVGCCLRGHTKSDRLKWLGSSSILAFHFKDGEEVCDIISEPFLFQTIVMVITLYILWFYSLWFTCFKNLLCQNFLFPYGIESGVIFSEWKHSVLRFSSWGNLSELVMEWKPLCFV